MTKDTCAKVSRMLVYDPATNTWQSVPLGGADVRAGTVGFDPSRNVMVMAGSAFCEAGPTSRICTCIGGPLPSHLWTR